MEADTPQTVREALFKRVMHIAERNGDIPVEEVERDVAEAVVHARSEREHPSPERAERH